MSRAVLNSPFDVLKHASMLSEQPLPITVTWQEGGKRSMSQNSLFHAWMGQIAKHTHDTPASVKADCHIRWGIPIFQAEDEVYAEFIKSALGGRPRSKVKDMIERGYIPCTSLMRKPVLSKYMDAIWREYAHEVTLMDPEETKWRDAA